MSQREDHDPAEIRPFETGQGLRGEDILAVLAVSTLLAAIGLATFFVTTAFGG